MRGEIEDLRGAVVVAVADSKDCAFGLVGVLPFVERAVFDSGFAGQFDGHEDVPFAAVKDDGGVFLGSAGIGDTLFGGDEGGGIFPYTGDLDSGAFGGGDAAGHGCSQDCAVD